MAASCITRRSPRLVPVSGRSQLTAEEERVLESVRFGYWAVGRTGIYFIDFDMPAEAGRPIKFFDFQARRVKELGTVENTVKWTNTPGFAISPDSRWVLYTSLESTEADLMLVDNFH